MTEATTVSVLVASITSLVDLSAKVVSQLRDISAKGADVPMPLQSLATRLPLLTQALTTLQARAQALDLPTELVSALTAFLNNTALQVAVVQGYLSSRIPTTTSRKRKAIDSIDQEDQIAVAVPELHQIIDVIVLHQHSAYPELHKHVTQMLSNLRSETGSQIAVEQGNSQFSRFTIKTGAKAHVGHSYDYRQSHHHYEAPKPPQLVPYATKHGLCLGSSPKIDRNLFHGRAADLQKMRDQLLPNGQHPCRQYLVLGGVGGIGKTQLALRYADCYRESYDSVFWLNASSEATLNLSFRHIAKLVFVSQDFSKYEDQQIVSTVHQWLSDVMNHRWLLIYDNYDEPKAYDIARFYPAGDQGDIVVTTRSPQEVSGQDMRVGPLEHVQDSLAILQSRSKRTNFTADKHAYALVKRLAGLPLALATAGTYLKTSVWTCQEYLNEYERRWNVNPRMPPHLPEYKNRTLYTTWDISFTRLQKQQPEAAQMLKLLAYFDNQMLWYDHFAAGASPDLPPWLRKASSDRVEFENLMNILVSQCFLEVQIASQSYGIHAAVHDWTLAVLNGEADPASYRYALACVRLSVVGDDLESLGHLRYSTTATHARRLTHDRFMEAEVLKEHLEIFYDNTWWVAALLNAQFSFGPAEHMYMRVLAGTEKVLGLEHASTLSALNSLGVLYFNQRKLDKAEKMFTRALTGYEKALRPEDIFTLQTTNNLGLLYRDQGKLEKAETMLERAVAGYKKVLGLEHTSVFDTIHNLGLLYSDQGKLDKANVMYEQALAGKEKVLGPDHLSTLGTVYNLGLLYYKQGKLSEAETMSARALAGREKALRLEHPSTLDAVENLGLLYSDQGKLDKANVMYERALAGREKVLGSDHLSTLGTVYNLGLLYYRQGKLEEAETMYARVLAVGEKALGSEHPLALDTVYNLGVLYYDKGKLGEAETMYARALTMGEKALGLDHHVVIRIRRNIEDIFKSRENSRVV